jgi:hypothetical protein
MAESVLTQQLLEEEHTADEYQKWVDSVIAKVQQEAGRLKRIRLREGLAKQLMNEADPIGILATKYFAASDQVRIRLRIGNQLYDAEVVDQRTNGSSVRYLEVTMAFEGEDDYLRMKALQETGEVAWLSKVIKPKVRKPGWKPIIPMEAISQNEVVLRETEKFKGAIERKVGKSYPVGTMLVIGFDDRMAFDHRENQESLASVISAYRSQLVGFHSIALVGMFMGFYRHWHWG